MTGIPRTHVGSSVAKLISNNVIFVSGKSTICRGQEVRSIGINKNYHQWLTVSEPVTVTETVTVTEPDFDRNQTGILTVTETVPTIDNTKDNTKDILKIKKEKVKIPEWIPKELWSEWMTIRVKKKAINSDIAIKGLINNLEKIVSSGKYTADYAIQTAIENSWKSVKLDWLDNQSEPHQGFSKPKSKGKIARAMEAFNDAVPNDSKRSNQNVSQELRVLTSS